MECQCLLAQRLGMWVAPRVVVAEVPVLALAVWVTGRHVSVYWPGGLACGLPPGLQKLKCQCWRRLSGSQAAMYRWPRSPISKHRLLASCTRGPGLMLVKRNTQHFFRTIFLFIQKNSQIYELIGSSSPFCPTKRLMANCTRISSRNLGKKKITLQTYMY